MTTPDGPPRPTRLLTVAWKVLASLAALLALGLGVGLALPGTWSVERETVVDAPTDSVFSLIDSLEGWDTWTPWPDVETTRSGPSQGEGATLRWDDPFLGDGVFRITESRRPSRLRYHVSVEGGSLTTEGVFRIEPEGDGTHIAWRERGDFGWNPLLAYAALTMDRVQGAELERGLARLRIVAETGALPDSLRRGSGRGGGAGL